MALARAGKLVSENLFLKAFSFVSALVLYSLVHTSQDVQRTVLVNVTVETPPDSVGRVLITPVPAQARVTLRGPKTLVDEVRAEDLGSFQLDVRRGTETRATFDASALHVPAGVKVEAVDPPVVELAWEERVGRDLPVQVSVVGGSAPGFKTRGLPVADPPNVHVRGPKSEVSSLQYARAEAFDLAGLGEGKHTRQLAVERLGPLVLVEPARLLATVEIARELTERLFSRVAVFVVGHPKARAHPHEVDVRVSCPPEVTRGLRSELLVPRAQLVNPGEHGSESVELKLTAERCEVVLIPSTVVVRW